MNDVQQHQHHRPPDRPLRWRLRSVPPRDRALHYRAIDRDNRVEWIDVNTDQRLLGALGVSREQALKRMHVLDADGVLRDGAAAFVALWSALPYYRFPARLVYHTRTTGLLEAAYRHFESWRYVQRRERLACAMPQRKPSVGQP